MTIIYRSECYYWRLYWQVQIDASRITAALKVFPHLPLMRGNKEKARHCESVQCIGNAKYRGIIFKVFRTTS